MMWVLIVLGALIAAVLVIAALRPSSFQVVRAATFSAPADKLYGLVEDFARWRDWSPWEALDPNMQRTLSGAAKGVGAVYAWNGNSKAGAGRMEITEAQAPARIGIKLDFTRPFAASNRIAFDFEPGSAGTRVTWTMQGSSPYMFRVMGLFMSMDKMVGKDFEKGLANLGRVAAG